MPLAAASLPASARVSSIAGRPGSSGAGKKPAWSIRSVRPRAIVRSNRPLQSLDPLGAERGIAEAAGLLDRLGRRVILAGKAQHGAGHHDPRRERRRGHAFAFIPTRVVRVAAGDLNDVDTQLLQKTLQLGDALDLKAPATHAQGKRRQHLMRRFRERLRHGRPLRSLDQSRFVVRSRNEPASIISGANRHCEEETQQMDANSAET